MAADGERFLDVAQNAKLIVNAERYYRAMYLGAHESWNLRDSHMFETLKAILDARGPKAKAVVWAHNSHIGNAAATDMTRRGEHNLGQLAREYWGHGAYLVGFGTHEGTVTAASGWDHPAEIMKVRPSHPGSYEYQFHQSGQGALMLPLRQNTSSDLHRLLLRPALERAIGVIYRPATEMLSHYFEATLPEQFDEYIWFDRTKAVTPLETAEIQGMPDTYPFGV
jgi:protein-L-isoaspartate(D-aspartate) O-methyltransferase